MSTSTSEPGSRLGDRYRLDDLIGATGGWALWKATDETLARPVALLALAPRFQRMAKVVAAARAASRLADARLARVFDVAHDPDQAYVVTEWVGGDSLEDLLADGPLDPRQGAEIIAQSAEALASAHAAGVMHLCLTPRSVRSTPASGVKIVGLGVDAAITGASADDLALADTQRLGGLLYAALTAHWPGGGWPPLPAAPEVHGYPRSPRQVRAGVPRGIDEVCRQVLLCGRPGGPDSSPLVTPAGLAAALNRVIPAPAVPLPSPAYLRRSAGPAARAHPPRTGGPPRDRTMGGQHPVATRMLASIGAVLVIAALGAGVWTLGKHGLTPAGGSTPSAPLPSSQASTVLKPVSAYGFDPLSSMADDPGDENTSQAGFAIDGNPDTAWHTQYYFTNPRFGGLKSGAGLILDMGRRVAVTSVTVTFGRVPGSNVRIEVGDDGSRAPATLGKFTVVAQGRDVSGRVKFPARGTPERRFVLIWFTKLPPQVPGSASRFEAEIFNVVVRGSY